MTDPDFWHRVVIVFHPLALVPLFLWVLWRYVPVLAEVGRVRVYLLVLLVCGAIAVQVVGETRAAYPLTTWTMYGLANPDPNAWRFVAIADDGREEHVPWNRIAPVREPRAFQRHLVTRLRPAEAGEVESGDGPIAEGLEQARGWLSELTGALNDRRPGVRVERVRVELCSVERFGELGPAGVPCRTILEVPAAAGRREAGRAPP